MRINLLTILSWQVELQPSIRTSSKRSIRIHALAESEHDLGRSERLRDEDAEQAEQALGRVDGRFLVRLGEREEMQGRDGQLVQVHGDDRYGKGKGKEQTEGNQRKSSPWQVDSRGNGDGEAVSSGRRERRSEGLNFAWERRKRSVGGANRVVAACERLSVSVSACSKRERSL